MVLRINLTPVGYQLNMSLVETEFNMSPVGIESTGRENNNSSQPPKLNPINKYVTYY
jgi:hypothetical protein